MLRATGERHAARAAAEVPEIAAELAEVVLDPPDRTFPEQATICLDDGREVELRYLGRGHTDNDIVLRIDGADVLCAGDLLENGATPSFGDGYPMDWPATAEALLALVGARTVVVPGTATTPVARSWSRSSSGSGPSRDAARRVARGRGDASTTSCRSSPTRPAAAREPVERARRAAPRRARTAASA